MFDGDENKYELWEVKFLGYMRLQKLHEVVVPAEDEKDAPDRERTRMPLPSLSNVWTIEVWPS